MPTENIYNKDGQLKEEIDPIKQPNGHAKLLCVNNNFLRVQQGMSGIINHRGSLEWVKIDFLDDGRWRVEGIKTVANIQAEHAKDNEEQRGYQMSKREP
eukprot:688115_1